MACDLRRSVVQVYPPVYEDEILYLAAKKLYRCICKLVVARQERQQRWARMQVNIIPIQRVVRGFLGRVGANKCRMLRQALRDWCRPTFATEYFDKYLESRVYKGFKDEAKTEVAEKPQLPQIQPFLEPMYAHAFNVPRKAFIPALQAFYVHKYVVCLFSP